jgi:hypothetical protein
MARSSSAQLVSLPEQAPREATPAAPVVLPALELPRARRPGWPTLASLAIATGLVALGLGGWAIVSGAGDDTAAGLGSTQLEEALTILAAPGAERVPLHGSLGRIVLVAAPDGSAVLALDGLGVAPAGRDYEAWVVAPGSATPAPAGTFDGSGRIVLLTRPAPPGARVAVTLEANGGVSRPTRPLRLVAELPA